MGQGLRLQSFVIVWLDQTIQVIDVAPLARAFYYLDPVVKPQDDKKKSEITCFSVIFNLIFSAI